VVTATSNDVSDTMNFTHKASVSPSLIKSTLLTDTHRMIATTSYYGG
jgi:hypothetical protein